MKNEPHISDYGMIDTLYAHHCYILCEA